MPAERFYINAPLTEGASVFLEDQEFHHLAHVMRGVEGEQVELVNGCGFLSQARIERIEKKRAQLIVTSLSYVPKNSFKLILAQAIPRLNRLDFIVEKGTELGMDELWLFPGELSERKNLTESQLERMQAVAVAAMKQCGRLYLPLLCLKKPLKNWELQELPLYFGDTDPSAPIFEKSWKLKSSLEGVIFVIGPESGLTAKETESLKSLKALGVALHPNILRTDTAALTALSLISHWQL